MDQYHFITHGAPLFGMEDYSIFPSIHDESTRLGRSLEGKTLCSIFLPKPNALMVSLPIWGKHRHCQYSHICVRLVHLYRSLAGIMI